MYMVYNLKQCEEFLLADGWKKSGVHEYPTNLWQSWRKGKYNILITEDKDHYDRFEAATELAKKRNLTNKQDRIELFALICGEMVDNTTN